MPSPPSLVRLAARAVPLPLNEPRIPHAIVAEVRYAALKRTREGRAMTRWAAENGDVTSMMRAYVEENKWDLGTTAAAAYHGHEECLRAAAALGAPWDPRTTAIAARFGHEACLRAAAALG